jgi:acyl-CoA synthetase (AMP-forming)/AMP-acid ligase II
MSSDKTFQTIRQLIKRNAALYPDKLAMKEYERGKAWTFGELWKRVNQVGNALYASGAKKGDRVSVLSQNSFEYAELFNAIPAAGFIFVPLNFRLALPEVLGVMNDAETSVLFLDAQYVQFTEQLKAGVPTLKHFIFIGPAEQKPEGWHLYDEFVGKASSDEVKEVVEEDDGAFFMYTSGTTGLPKGVIQTHLNHYHNARTTVMHHDITPDDVGFTCCPMYHITAYTSFSGTFYVGAPNILFQKFDPENLFKAVQEYKLSAGMLATPMIRMILDSFDDIKHYDYSSLKKIWFAGAGIIPTVYKEFIDRVGVIPGQHMGTTETTGCTTLLSRKDIADELAAGYDRVLASCGKASYDAETQVVDDNDNVISRGTGEMRTRGLGLTKGYWKKEEQTKAAFKNGWFYTEDICEIDDKGYIYVIDRKKDMIITGGENVYPLEIERVVNEYPGVRECSAIGIPHPVWGEAVAVVVVMNNGDKVTDQDIVKFCKGKIAGYKVPKIVHFVPELPRNASGKVLKHELRKRYKEE